MKKFWLAFIWLAWAWMVCGCAHLRTKGGVTSASVPGAVATLQQPENPKEASVSDLDSESEEVYTVPAGSVIEEGTSVPATSVPATRKNTQTNPVVKRTRLSEDMPVKKTTKHSARQKVGAAQKDEIGAQIAAMKAFRWLQIVGAVVFLGGVLSAVWPPAKAIVGGSLTTSAAIAASGVFLIFFPPFFVGHEVLIFVACAAGAGLWFLAHRHGGVQGELKALKAAVSTSGR